MDGREGEGEKGSSGERKEVERAARPFKRKERKKGKERNILNTASNCAFPTSNHSGFKMQDAEYKSAIYGGSKYKRKDSSHASRFTFHAHLYSLMLRLAGGH